MSRLRIATRASDLALAQARWTAERIESTLGVEVEIVAVRTTGDRLRRVALARYGGKGLFVKELEEALREGRADVAVHSAKDLPAQVPSEFELAVFPERADPRDALVTRRRGERLETLPRGARVGTGSPRRRAQLRALRPDLDVRGLRGNVPTRLRRLDEGRFDALVLACAGLDRLGLGDRIDERLAPEVLLPAVGQGALALETRAGLPLAKDLAVLADPDATAALRAERAFLAHLEGDCHVPIAGFGELRADGGVRVRGLVAGADGDPVVRGEAEDIRPETAGVAAAEAILVRGGAAVLAQARAEASA